MGTPYEGTVNFDAVGVHYEGTFDFDAEDDEHAEIVLDQIAALLRNHRWVLNPSMSASKQN